ncbi:nucleoside permease [Candidatus Sumerlaeota bacterium]|nr:nucleoside permease [Candidatus Sumerlaeota bacterium]
MKAVTYSKLSIMMVLQYAVWGIWLPVIASYLQSQTDKGGLGFTPGQVAWILGSAGSIGAVTSPFIAGQIADRWFSAERFLAVLLLLGSIIKWVTAYCTDFSAWLILSILYSILFMPTLALTNSIAFSHIDNPNTQFPRIRMWGTIGWILASWIFPMVWLQSNLHFSWLPPFLVGDELPDSISRLVDSMKIAGVTSILYAGFCLCLPNTPPKRDSVEPLAFRKAFGLFHHKSFAVLVIASLIISVIHQIYFVETAPFFQSIGLRPSSIGPAMSIGQFAEFTIIIFLGWMLTKFGFKWTLFLGCMAYVLRYAIFSATFLPTWVIVTSQLFHGFCYACFFAVSYIYVDRLAAHDIRHSAQTVFSIIILGIGPVLAAPTVVILSRFCQGATAGDLNFSRMWLLISALGALTAFIIATCFKDETKNSLPAVED